MREVYHAGTGTPIGIFWRSGTEGAATSFPGVSNCSISSHSARASTRPSRFRIHFLDRQIVTFCDVEPAAGRTGPTPALPQPYPPGGGCQTKVAGDLDCLRCRKSAASAGRAPGGCNATHAGAGPATYSALALDQHDR